MVRVAICQPCRVEMLETEVLDHIEKKNHADSFRKLAPSEYREWFKKNVKIEERDFRPGEAQYLKNVHSFGIATSERH